MAPCAACFIHQTYMATLGLYPWDIAIQIALVLKKIQVPPPTLLMIIHRVTFTRTGKLVVTRVRSFDEQLAAAVCLHLMYQGASMPNAAVKIGSSFI